MLNVEIETRTYPDQPNYISLLFALKGTDKGLAVSFRTEYKDYDDYLDVIESAALALRDHIEYLRENKAEYEYGKP